MQDIYTQLKCFKCQFLLYRYLKQVNGISDPNPTQHELYLDLEPHLGGLVAAQARFQLNLVLRNDPAFEVLAKVPNITVLPIFWVTEGYKQLPEGSMQKLNLALMLPSLFANGLILICVIIGVILLLWTLVQGAKSYLAEQQLYKFKQNFEITQIPSDSKNLYNPLPCNDLME